MTRGFSIHTAYMKKLGITKSHGFALISEAAGSISLEEHGSFDELVDLKLQADEVVFGIDYNKLLTKRVWVDQNLTDRERVAFLKENDQSYLDYEEIDYDHQRVCLHSFSIDKQILNNDLIQLKKINLVPSRVETILHGLARAIVNIKKIHDQVLQFLLVYDDYALSVVFKDQQLIYFKRSNTHSEPLFAIREVLQYYRCDPQEIEVDQGFYINYSQNTSFDGLVPYEFDVPCKKIDFDTAQWLIPFGLTCGEMKLEI